MKIQIIFLLIIFCSSPVLASDDYVAIDPSSLQTVNGTTLLAVSYAIVLGMLALYWVYMIIQSRKATHQIDRLERDISHLTKD